MPSSPVLQSTVIVNLIVVLDDDFDVPDAPLNIVLFGSVLHVQTAGLSHHRYREMSMIVEKNACLAFPLHYT